ncbi:hypothetical protein PHISCL_07328 [Aspergillus sclerotialis]|uniref:Uncharacterized protein n=1 Tax=Aspergillus sclerotialis TaxID=2070753 RepID=A0A3A2ZTK6_9EURO|nr:hypothetical protein PHISCL_07328 [Aspergillus sclerotialis]
MTKLAEGMKTWPGFSVNDIHADMAAAGCVNFDLQEYTIMVVVPGETHGMFIAKASVV